MKNRKPYILILAVIWIFTIQVQAQTNGNQSKLVVFTDRDFCVSGDTLWFKVAIPEKLAEEGNVVHVQLDSPYRNLIASVIKRGQDGWADGYLFIPDSLSTGCYFLSAFLNSQRINRELETVTQSLFVFNRFSENVFETSIPGTNFKVNDKYTDGDVVIKTAKPVYGQREKVSAQISFDDRFKQEINDVVVKATLLNDLAAESGGRFQIKQYGFNRTVPVLREKDGFVLTGKVYNKTGSAKKGVLVFLSVPGEIAYFDYYVTGDEGDFHFYIKNAEGIAGVFMQAISATGDEYEIRTEKNHLVTLNDWAMNVKILSEDQSEAANSIIRANFFTKLFKQSLMTIPDTLKMPPRFNIPFYGSVYNQVLTSEFIDLPDFQEISRELLPGVQYRIRNGESTFRLINDLQRDFFDGEPLRLLNGIPVFKNNLFSSLKSNDIEYIRTVNRERVFGDLVIKGVLDVSLVDKSNSWIVTQPNLYRFDVMCLQPDKKAKYQPAQNVNESIPDFRQVYFFETVKTSADINVDFQLSDIKGKVEISVEGVNKNQEIVKFNKIIEIK